jgi:hypothetical protein
MLEDYQMSVIHTQRMWVEHAEQYGDSTYLTYVDRPLRTELQNYTGSIHNEKDFATWDKKAPFALNKSLRACTESECENIVADLEC